MKDTDHIFNARLQSRTDRAIEFHQGDNVPKAAIQQLVRQGIILNTQKSKN